jgi:hypothetical protein
MIYLGILRLSPLTTLLLILCQALLAGSQSAADSTDALQRLQQIEYQIKRQERAEEGFRIQLRGIQESLVSLKEDVGNLKDQVALYGPVPVDGFGEEKSELEELRAEVERLRDAVALVGSAPLLELPPPLGEDLPPLLMEGLELPEEEPSDGSSPYAPWIALFCIGLLLLLVFWGGSHWGERRLRSGEWEYHKVEDPGEEQIQALGREGWECIGIISEQQEDRGEKIHTFKRPRSIDSGRPFRRTISFLFFLAGLAVIAAVMGGPATFIDVPSLLIVFAGTALFTLAHVPFREIVEAVHCALGSAQSGSEESEKARLTFAIMRSYALAMGVLGFFIGLILMLKNMDDPAAIGPGMALSLLSVLYAVGLAQILISALDLQIVRNLQAEGDRQLPESADRGLLTTLLAVLMGASLFGGLLLAL